MPPHVIRAHTLKSLALFLVPLSLSAQPAATGAAGSAQGTAKEARQLDDKVPKHLPVVVRVKNLDGEKWFRDLEVEVKNVSRKPIYFLSFSVHTVDLKSEDGHTFGFQLRYGRPALINLREQATPEDAPVGPGESVVLRISASSVAGWEKYTAARGIAQPGKLGLSFRALSYGDGTGYHITDGSAVPHARAILVDVAGNGLQLTDAAGGIEFDLNGDGTLEKFAWTVADSDDAWLVLDRNGSGKVDQAVELFDGLGPRPLANAGFTGLAAFDRPENGGNGDGAIDAADAVFTHLRLWQDKNRNGVSEPSELHRLPALDVARLSLPGELAPRADEHGNRFLYRARVVGAKDSQLGRWAWDVELRAAR